MLGTHNPNLKAGERRSIFLGASVCLPALAAPSSSVIYKMKTKISSLLSVGLFLLTMLVLPMSGCKTVTSVITNPDGSLTTNTVKQIDTVRVAAISRQAATVGTSEILAAHPEWRPQFQLAAEQLALLAASPTLGLQDILNIAAQLPVKELKSQTARLSFEGATLLISAIDVPALPADRLAELQPIAKAISDGIMAGLPPAPAVPVPIVPSAPAAVTN